MHRKTHGKIGFAEMARVIGSKWKTLDETAKKEYEDEAEREKKRYEVELEAWKESQRVKTLELEAESQKQQQQQQGIEAAAAAAHQSGLLAAMQQQQLPQHRGSLDMTSQRGYPSDAAFMMMADRERLLQQQQAQLGPHTIGSFRRDSQGLSSMEYLRALQERRQMDRSGFVNPQMLDMQLPSYPNAAAASANALMQLQQQQQQLMQMQQQQQQLQAQLRQSIAATSRMGAGLNVSVGGMDAQSDLDLQYAMYQSGRQLNDMGNDFSGSMYFGGNNFRGM